MSRKVCIVTPDIVGPVFNGGIGTHCYFLARFITRRLHHNVTVLFTGPLRRGTTEEWKAFYAKQGIEFVNLHDELPTPARPIHAAEWFVVNSMIAYDFLKKRGFDVIHFQDWQATGFISIQAKRSGLAFAETLLTVTLNSPEQWIFEGLERWYEHPIQQAQQSWCERYCCEHADMLISPAEFMFRWAQERHWKLAESKRVVPYLYETREDISDISGRPIDPGHLIFFGRLETRKGFELFCDSYNLLSREQNSPIEKITFLGRPGMTKGTPALEAIDAFSRLHPKTEITVHSDLDTFAALKQIKESGGVVVIPSLLDNLPFTVIECIEYDIPFIASQVGGIVELADPRVTFAPNPRSLARLLMSLNSTIQTTPQHLYSRERAEEEWWQVHQTVTRPPSPPATPAPKKVSVCVAYYNYGNFLPDLLSSLRASEYQEFEVIVVNDGSTEASSVEAFREMEREYAPLGWRFLSKENGGIGHTRNFAAQNATGEHLIFMDADNIAKPQMIGTMVRAMELSGSDCLTCHFDAFQEEAKTPSEDNRLFSYVPIGPCAEVGMFVNVFGDANFVIKKSVFDELGGFTTDRDTSFEDWEFLAKLTLKGYSLDVIPESLLWYRYGAEGFSRVTNYYRNQRRMLRPYQESASLSTRHMITDVLLPLGKLAIEAEPRFDGAWLSMAPPRVQGLWRLRHRLFPKGTTLERLYLRIANRIAR